MWCMSLRCCKDLFYNTNAGIEDVFFTMRVLHSGLNSKFFHFEASVKKIQSHLECHLISNYNGKYILNKTPMKFHCWKQQRIDNYRSLFFFLIVQNLVTPCSLVLIHKSKLCISMVTNSENQKNYNLPNLQNFIRQCRVVQCCTKWMEKWRRRMTSDSSISPQLISWDVDTITGLNKTIIVNTHRN